MRYPADDASSHEYEVKRVHTDDPTELAHIEWLAPLSGRPIPVSVRNIHLADASDISRVLDRPRKASRDLYGFSPIPAGGRPVTNELVNELREALGY